MWSGLRQQVSLIKSIHAAALILVLLAGCASDLENRPAHVRHFRAPTGGHSRYTSALQLDQKPSHHKPHLPGRASAQAPYFRDGWERHTGAHHTPRPGV
jgi:hypothetical protein